MSALMDILMVLFLRAKPWQLVLAVVVLWSASIVAFRMDFKAAFSLVGGFIHLWLYAICRFAAIQSGRFGGFRAFTLFCLVLLLAYWAQWAIQAPVMPVSVAVASAVLAGSFWAAAGVGRLRREDFRVVPFWAALFSFWCFPIGVWYIQPILNSVAGHATQGRNTGLGE